MVPFAADRITMMNARLPVVILALAWGCGAAPAQLRTSMDEATVHVRTWVQPQIAISMPAVMVINLEAPLLGSIIPGQVRFHVRANTEEVELQVACTDLYKAGDPRSEYRIPVAEPGATVTCENDHARLLSWQDAPSANALPAGWMGEISEVGLFTTTSGPIFSQDVSVEVAWDTANLDLPTGEYQGIVRLIGLARP